MKQAIAYSAYFLIVATVTYFVEFFLFFMISGILFNAADAPPGDISDEGKLMLSVGIPSQPEKCCREPNCTRFCK